jgi:hypothetical protein
LIFVAILLHTWCYLSPFSFFNLFSTSFFAFFPFFSLYFLLFPNAHRQRIASLDLSLLPRSLRQTPPDLARTTTPGLLSSAAPSRRRCSLHRRAAAASPAALLSLSLPLSLRWWRTSRHTGRVAYIWPRLPASRLLNPVFVVVDYAFLELDLIFLELDFVFVLVNPAAAHHGRYGSELDLGGDSGANRGRQSNLSHPDFFEFQDVIKIKNK